MNTISPALASASQALFTQASGLNDPLAKEPKLTDKTASAASSAQNTTVTLSDQSENNQSSYTDLKQFQTVNEKQSVESSTIEAKESNRQQLAEKSQAAAQQKTQYAADLQTQSNYFSSQKAEI